MERSLVVMAWKGAGALKSIGRRDMESFVFFFFVQIVVFEVCEEGGGLEEREGGRRCGGRGDIVFSGVLREGRGVEREKE